MQTGLYIVGTPIGNLSDMSPRAIDVLKNVDLVAAEDTRVFGKIASHFDIKTPRVSCHEHNERAVIGGLIEKIRGGASVAVVTDAGMPCISDPGEVLVQMCAENGIEVRVVPGPSAVVSAVALSGFPARRFTFEGFLPVQKKERAERLENLRNETAVMVFYEAPHKLKTTLSDLAAAFGDDRKIAICRELTKVHEEILRMTLAEAKEYYSVHEPKGEFVLVVHGGRKSDQQNITIEQALEQVRCLVEMGERPVDACKAVAKDTGFRKGELYSAFCTE